LWGLGVDPSVLDTVRAACSEGQMLSCVYASVSSKTKKARKLGPHYLYFAKGSLYLVGEEIETKVVKTFSIPRMSETEMLDEPYEGTKTDPEVHFRDSFGVFRGETPQEIVLSFSREMSSFIKERSWHPSQQIISKADGTIEMQIYVALTPELKQWIFGFGSQVLVLKPATLKEEIQAEAFQILKLYSPQSKAS
jgi:predicted DNA-binding transcriptional regulator YafY